MPLHLLPTRTPPCQTSLLDPQQRQIMHVLDVEGPTHATVLRARFCLHCGDCLTCVGPLIQRGLVGQDRSILLITPAGRAIACGISLNNDTDFITDLSSATFDSYWIWSLGSTSSISIAAGFMNSAGGPGQDGIYIRYNTGTDSSYTFVICKASSCTASTTNSIAANTSFHTFRIRSTTAGTILFSVDGGTETAISTNVPTASMETNFRLQTLTTATKAMNIDKFSFSSTLTR